MPNISVDLPLPAGNGPGPSVDTSLLGRQKTIVINGDYPGASITVEMSVDGGVIWAPVYTFHEDDRKKQVEVVAQFMRAVVRNRTIFTGVNVDVSAPESETLYVNLPLPVAAGPGPAVPVDALGLFKTAIVGGAAFPGSSVFVEVSGDGVDFAPFWGFSQGDSQSGSVAANFMRIRVTGNNPPVGVTCDVGADQFSGGSNCEECLTDDPPITVTGPTNSVGTATEGSRGDHQHRLEVMVEDEGAAAGARPILNFLGAGVTAVDNPGGDKVDITIPGAAPHDCEDCLSDGNPITVTGPANTPGVAPLGSRADHQHRLGLLVDDEGVVVGPGRPEINFIGMGVGAVDNPGLDRVDVTIPGNVTDGAVVKRSLYKGDTVQVTAMAPGPTPFVDGMSGGSVAVPIDGDYLVIFEGEGDNQSASGALEIGISKNSLVAVVADSSRLSKGAAADTRAIVTSVQLPGCIAGDLVRCLFRRSTGAGAVSLMRRHLIIIKVQ
jgi:hypothetical protein